MLYEVRCCCEPDKLLGWLEVHVNGREVRFRRRAGGDIVLRLREFEPTPGKIYRALDSGGFSVNTLRTLPGFMVNNGPASRVPPYPYLYNRHSP